MLLSRASYTFEKQDESRRSTLALEKVPYVGICTDNLLITKGHLRVWILISTVLWNKQLRQKHLKLNVLQMLPCSATLALQEHAGPRAVGPSTHSYHPAVFAPLTPLAWFTQPLHFTCGQDQLHHTSALLSWYAQEESSMTLVDTALRLQAIFWEHRSFTAPPFAVFRG